MRDRDGGVTGSFFQFHDVGQFRLHRQVAVAGYEACLETLDAADHFGLGVNALGAEDEGEAAFTGERDRHAVV